VAVAYFTVYETLMEGLADAVESRVDQNGWSIKLQRRADEASARSTGQARRAACVQPGGVQSEVEVAALDAVASAEPPAELAGDCP